MTQQGNAAWDRGVFVFYSIRMAVRAPFGQQNVTRPPRKKKSQLVFFLARGCFSVFVVFCGMTKNIIGAHQAQGAILAIMSVDWHLCYVHWVSQTQVARNSSRQLIGDWLYQYFGNPDTGEPDWSRYRQIELAYSALHGAYPKWELWLAQSTMDPEHEGCPESTAASIMHMIVLRPFLRRRFLAHAHLRRPLASTENLRK